MQMLERINSKMQAGWKMTDVPCPNCNGTTMAQPKEDIDILYCPKENKEYPFELQQSPRAEVLKESDSQSQRNQQFYDKIGLQFENASKKVVQQPKNSENLEKLNTFDNIFMNQKETEAMRKTNDVSKKIGEKLLQGWTMLNESCNDCYAPIMKSRKGEKICFGCNKDVTKKVENVVAQKREIVEQPKRERQEPIKANERVAQPNVAKEVTVQKAQKQQSKEIIQPSIQPKNIVNNEPKEPHNTIFDRIEQKSLIFLEAQLEKSMANVELSRMQKLLSLVYKIKNEFK